jgi:hypothetical protein
MEAEVKKENRAIIPPKEPVYLEGPKEQGV